MEFLFPDLLHIASIATPVSGLWLKTENTLTFLKYYLFSSVLLFVLVNRSVVMITVVVKVIKMAIQVE